MNTQINIHEHDFLKNIKDLILVTYGGSHAYGTDIPDSDIDIRGVALNPTSEILLNQDFDQYTDPDSDTVIYSFNKIIKLLTECNPNVIEILGCRDYLYLSETGKLLLKNRHLFLSKRCIHTFGGYANAQLRRLNNKSSRQYKQSEKEEHILKTLLQAQYKISPKYQGHQGQIGLYTDKAINPELITEIFIDVDLKHYPLRDYLNLWSELNNIRQSFDRLGKRNKMAIARNKLSKHMMHLIRLYIMGIDILEKQEIITYRKNERDLLLDIRNNAQNQYLDEQNVPTDRFFRILNAYQKEFDHASENTLLPDMPDIQAIQNLQIQVNGAQVTSGKQSFPLI